MQQTALEPAGVPTEPPADSFSQLASLSPDVVAPGDASTEITITADDAPLGSGTYFRIERWDGERWALQHHVWHGEVQPADLEGFNDDGYDIEPGEALVEQLPLDDLDTGVHRVGLEMRAGDDPDVRLDVYARLDVRPGAQDDAPALTQLDGSEWRSVVVEGLDLPADQQIQLTFSHGRVGARVACNYVDGPYDLIDGHLAVDSDEVTSTLIGCPPPEGSWDEWVTGLLLGSPTVEIDDEDLTLSAGGDTVVFERYVEPTPTPTDPDAPLSTWVPPADYRYTIWGSCGPDARFFGDREVIVQGGVPSDQAAFLPTLLADAEAIRADGADVVTVEHDPDAGHPTAILWDVDSNASTDSEVCYGVTDFEDLTAPPPAEPTDAVGAPAVPPPESIPAAIVQAELVGPSTLALGIASCNADLFTTVVETDVSVEATVHQVGSLEDCMDGVTIELDRPLGDRALVDTSTGEAVQVEVLFDS